MQLKFISVFGLLATLVPISGEPLRIGNRLEPLVDDYLIDKWEGAELALHKPVAREVVFVHDAPWEGNVCCYHTIFKDGNLYKMYYRGLHFDRGTGPMSTCYAESKDGLNWTRPNLGLFEFNGSKSNNIIYQGDIAHNFTPFLDENPNCKPEAKYKSVGSTSEPALVALQSPDGIHWSPMSDKPIIRHGDFDSQNLAFWDALRGLYVDFHRKGRNGVRDIMTSTSKNFLDWSEPEFIEYPGIEPEHLYTNAIRPYHRAPHIYLGFPKRFSPSRNGIPGDPYPGVSDGVFMSSRDGKHFKRWKEAIVRPGLQKERWGNRNNMTAWGMIETPSAIPGTPPELSIYSTEAYYMGKATRLRRYTYRLDGFVSASAKGKPGEFTTKPLVFTKTKDKNAGKGILKPELALPSSKPMFGDYLQIRSATYLEIPGTANLGKEVTLAAHLRAVPAGLRRLFSSYDGGMTVPNELFFDFDSRDGIESPEEAIRFEYNGTKVSISRQLVPAWSEDKDPDKIHHLAATWKDGEITVYFDGKKVGQGGAAGKGEFISAKGGLRFGEDFPPTPLTNEPLIGDVDNILVLRRALSESEIARLTKGELDGVIKRSDAGVLYTGKVQNEINLLDELGADETQNLRIGSESPQMTLMLNYSTSGAGWLRCEIQDESGRPLPGYGLGESDEIYGDSVAQPMSWRGGQREVSSLAEKPVRLRFVMLDADLFSIQFK